MSPGILRSVQVPESSVTIKTSVIDVVTIHSGNLNALYEPPIPGVEKLHPVPCLSFLLEHPSGQKLLFDLGVPKDIDTLGPEVATRLRQVGHQVHVKRDVADELKEHGLRREEINGVIWSHTHWDVSIAPARQQYELMKLAQRRRCELPFINVVDSWSWSNGTLRQRRW